jgi:hypothetical protein
MNNNSKVMIGLSVVVLLIGIFSVKNWNQSAVSNNDYSGSVAGIATKVTLYKSSSCSCCGSYAKYLEKKGFSVDVINRNDMSSVKDEHGIPGNMESCHTTLIGDYVVEGHIPVEAIEKLLAESPDIKGIAMPGMPQGSPGMPGFKSRAFSIHSINSDGSTSKFMEL